MNSIRFLRRSNVSQIRINMVHLAKNRYEIPPCPITALPFHYVALSLSTVLRCENRSSQRWVCFGLRAAAHLRLESAPLRAAPRSARFQPYVLHDREACFTSLSHFMCLFHFQLECFSARALPLEPLVHRSPFGRTSNKSWQLFIRFGKLVLGCTEADV